jgi:hypothetical protein
MALPELTPQLSLLEEAMTILFCRIDDAYYHLNPEGRHSAPRASKYSRIRSS